MNSTRNSSASESIAVVALLGPTALGKSAVALALAELTGGEVVSADSVQVYRQLDIGSAKPSRADRERVPHHLLDVVDPDQPYDVVQYREAARQVVDGLLARGKLPIVVGGTGFYVRALLREGDLPPVGGCPEVRQRLEREAAERGLAGLLARLQEVDPVAAARLDRANPRRVLRALEIFDTTGRPQSDFRGLAKDAPLRYNAALLGLSCPREQLHRRIDERVDQMMAAGFDAEVKSLLAQGYSPELPALQALGYKQWLLHLSGKLTAQEALSLWKRNTRRYARRQYTWFRAEAGMRWLEAGPSVDPAAVAQQLAEDYRLLGGQ